jgi:serine/threonine protein kinase
LLVQTAVVAGSLGYLSPEVRSGEAMTEAGDVYALGAVLYFAATGHHPEPRPNLAGIIEPGLRKMMSDCLAHDPARRPAAIEIQRRLNVPVAITPLTAAPTTAVSRSASM